MSNEKRMAETIDSLRLEINGYQDEAKEREFESSLIEVLTSTEFESDEFVQGLFRLRLKVALCKLKVGIENKSILNCVNSFNCELPNSYPMFLDGY